MTTKTSDWHLFDSPLFSLYRFMSRQHVYDLEKRRGDCLIKWLIMLGFTDLRGPRVCRRSTPVLLHILSTNFRRCAHVQGPLLLQVPIRAVYYFHKIWIVCEIIAGWLDPWMLSSWILHIITSISRCTSWYWQNNTKKTWPTSISKRVIYSFHPAIDISCDKWLRRLLWVISAP